jgi:hypothetical protein
MMLGFLCTPGVTASSSQLSTHALFPVRFQTWLLKGVTSAERRIRATTEMTFRVMIRRRIIGEIEKNEWCRVRPCAPNALARVG